jgi:phospholipid/cholesterol/gamma-HCH transport system ATP-binding protein
MTTEQQTSSEKEPVRVKIENLSKSFGDQSILKEINLDIAPGEIFVLMGPSGSGKSVLLKHIAGLEMPTAGTVTLNGAQTSDPDTFSNTKIALVFQAGALFNSMSVFDNLALYPREHRLYPPKKIREKVMSTLRILSLENAAKKFPSELSGGMKKRVAIARALVMEPDLILYDEPTSELDPTMAATISEIIACLKEEIHVTSIVVSHDRDLSLTIADRVGIIMDGEIQAIGTPEEIKENNDPVITEFLNPKIDLNNPRYKTLE